MGPDVLGAAVDDDLDSRTPRARVVSAEACGEAKETRPPRFARRRAREVSRVEDGLGMAEPGSPKDGS